MWPSPISLAAKDNSNGWEGIGWKLVVWRLASTGKTEPIVATGASSAAQMPSGNCISRMTGPGPPLWRLMENSRVAWVTLLDLCCHRGLLFSALSPGWSPAH